MHTVLILLISLAIAHASSEQTKHEERLKDTLMKGYLTNAAPTFPVNVTISIDLTSLNEFDIVSGFGQMNLVFRSQWNDDRLVSDPSRYGGLSQLFMDTNELVEPRIWTPDVLCSTCVEQSLAESTAIVFYNGDVIWGRYGNFKILVPFSLAHFPFDDQYFDLNFYSWSIYPPDLYL